MTKIVSSIILISFLIVSSNAEDININKAKLEPNTKKIDNDINAIQNNNKKPIKKHNLSENSDKVDSLISLISDMNEAELKSKQSDLKENLNNSIIFKILKFIRIEKNIFVTVEFEQKNNSNMQFAMDMANNIMNNPERNRQQPQLQDQNQNETQKDTITIRPGEKVNSEWILQSANDRFVIFKHKSLDIDKKIYLDSIEDGNANTTNNIEG